jgi:antitoxin component of RelBE/YafQ-DinJ toxin-antitoxin module
MKAGRLQLRLDPKLKEQADKAVRRRHTTLTAAITQFLQQLVETDRVERRVSEEVDQV